MNGEYYKMDYEAWNEGTYELTLEQEAAYLRLCHQMYRRGGPIPNSKHLLCALFRSGHTRATALLNKLIKAGKIFVTNNGELANQRVLRELAERSELLAKKRAAGHYGGIHKKAVATPATPDQTPTKPRADPDQVPSNPRATLAKSLNGHDPPEASAKLGEERRGEEKQKEKESSLRSPKKSMNGHGPPSRGSRIDATWQPSTSDTDFAAEKGLEPFRITATADRFRDYWLGAAGSSAVKLDWSAAWRNWVRKDLEDRATGTPREERRDQFGRRVR